MIHYHQIRTIVERNGAVDRVRESKIGARLALIAGSYLLLVFVTPLTMEPGTIPELSGRANLIDYATVDGWGSWGNGDNGEDSPVGHNQFIHGGVFAWTEHGPLVAIVYMIGDINCHQKYDRSYEVNGNQTAICARDVGILLGFLAGAIVWSRYGLNRYSIRDSFLSILPDKWVAPLYRTDRRLIAMWAIIIAGLAPTGIDGFTQLLTDYESTNIVRILTGSTMGAALAWLIAATICARGSDFNNVGEVLLPAESRLKIR